MIVRFNQKLCIWFYDAIMAIRMIKNLFRKVSHPSFGGAERPEKRSYDDAPQPMGDWGLIVDAQGDPVIGRKAGSHDFIARHPVEFIYAGTIPAPNRNEYPDSRNFLGAVTEHAVRNHHNKILLDKAVFLLSQTDDGRRLLSLAKSKGFHFVFDDERTKNEGAVGLCDYTNKQIPLAEGRSAVEVALTLKHELQHMEDISKGVIYNHTHSLGSSIMADRALEANARVSEAVTCIEILNGNPNGPERQFRTSALFANFFQKNEPMAALAFEHRTIAEKGDWINFGRKVFAGYFSQHATLDYYDRRQVDMYTDCLTISPDKVFDPADQNYADLRRHFGNRNAFLQYGAEKLDGVGENDYWTYHQDVLKEKITVKGLESYLAGTSDLDLSDKKHCNIGSAAQKGMDSFIKGAKEFIPHGVERLEIALAISDRQVPPMAPIISPYDDAGAPQKPLQVIQLPCRYDGDKTSDGSTHYHIITQIFEESYKQSVNYPEPLDKISIAIEGIQRRSYDGRSNIRGMMNDLVGAGLRVPVAALSDHYLIHLSRMLVTARDTGSTKDLSNADLTLLQHWRDMAKAGVDPVYGNDFKNKDDLLFSEYKDAHYKSYLKPYIDVITKDMKLQSPSAAKDSDLRKARAGN